MRRKPAIIPPRNAIVNLKSRRKRQELHNCAVCERLYPRFLGDGLPTCSTSCADTYLKRHPR